MRVAQPEKRRGSQKWIQRAVNERWESLEQPILAALGRGAALSWRSPLQADDFAEYRDAAYLNKIGHPELVGELAVFWPARGPQWDALGRSLAGDVLLVEAKAHIDELCSSPTAAGPIARAQIEAALESVATRLGANSHRAAWSQHFYQLANRLAHLDFLRQRGVTAWLVLVDFVGDADVGGPSSAEVWEAAYAVAAHVMGLPRRHPLEPYVIHVCPDVRDHIGSAAAEAGQRAPCALGAR